MRKWFQSAIQSQDMKFQIKHGKSNKEDYALIPELECIFKAICADNRNSIHF